MTAAEDEGDLGGVGVLVTGSVTVVGEARSLLRDSRPTEGGRPTCVAHWSCDIAASVLVFEAIIVRVGDSRWRSRWATLSRRRPSLGESRSRSCASWWPGSLARPWGYPVGWVVQGLILRAASWCTAMFIVGGLFAALWWSASRRTSGRGASRGAMGRGRRPATGAAAGADWLGFRPSFGVVARLQAASRSSS